MTRAPRLRGVIGGVRVEERGLLGSDFGADGQDHPSRRLGRHDDRIEAIVGFEQSFAVAADGSAQERDGAGLPAEPQQARATLLPLPPTTSARPPRTMSPGRQGGTVRVLSRHGFRVTHRIILLVRGQFVFVRGP